MSLITSEQYKTIFASLQKGVKYNIPGGMAAFLGEMDNEFIKKYIEYASDTTIIKLIGFKESFDHLNEKAQKALRRVFVEKIKIFSAMNVDEKTVNMKKNIAWILSEDTAHNDALNNIQPEDKDAIYKLFAHAYAANIDLLLGNVVLANKEKTKAILMAHLNIIFANNSDHKKAYDIFVKLDCINLIPNYLRSLKTVDPIKMAIDSMPTVTGDYIAKHFYEIYHDFSSADVLAIIKHIQPKDSDFYGQLAVIADDNVKKLLMDCFIIEPSLLLEFPKEHDTINDIIVKHHKAMFDAKTEDTLLLSIDKRYPRAELLKRTLTDSTIEVSRFTSISAEIARRFVELMKDQPLASVVQFLEKDLGVGFFSALLNSIEDNRQPSLKELLHECFNQNPELLLAFCEVPNKERLAIVFDTQNPLDSLATSQKLLQIASYYNAPGFLTHLWLPILPKISADKIALLAGEEKGIFASNTLISHLTQNQLTKGVIQKLNPYNLTALTDSQIKNMVPSALDFMLLRYPPASVKSCFQKLDDEKLKQALERLLSNSNNAKNFSLNHFKAFEPPQIKMLNSKMIKVVLDIHAMNKLLWEFDSFNQKELVAYLGAEHQPLSKENSFCNLLIDSNAGRKALAEVLKSNHRNEIFKNEAVFKSRYAKKIVIDSEKEVEIFDAISFEKLETLHKEFKTNSTLLLTIINSVFSFGDIKSLDTGIINSEIVSIYGVAGSSYATCNVERLFKVFNLIILSLKELDQDGNLGKNLKYVLDGFVIKAAKIDGVNSYYTLYQEKLVADPRWKKLTNIYPGLDESAIKNKRSVQPSLAYASGNSNVQAQEELLKKTEAIGSLQGENRRLQDEAESLRNRYNRINEDLQKSTALQMRQSEIINTQTHDLEEASSIAIRQKSNLQGLTRDLEQKREELAKCESELNVKGNEIRQKSEALNEAFSLIKKSEKENKKIRSLVDNLAAQVDELKKALEKSDDLNHAKEIKLKKLKKENGELNRNLNELMGVGDTFILRKQIQDTTGAISKLMELISSDATTPDEKTLYIGVLKMKSQILDQLIEKSEAPTAPDFNSLEQSGEIVVADDIHAQLKEYLSAPVDGARRVLDALSNFFSKQSPTSSYRCITQDNTDLS